MATTPFSIRIDTDTKAKLEEWAARENRSASALAQLAIDEYLDQKTYKRECILEALDEAKKGVFISEDAMDAWVDSWGTDNELPAPDPDIFPDKSAA
ncbi:MAG: CopG family ribbon-helix-helix protein [Aestuariivirga sp.]